MVPLLARLLVLAAIIASICAGELNALAGRNDISLGAAHAFPATGPSANTSSQASQRRRLAETPSRHPILSDFCVDLADNLLEAESVFQHAVVILAVRNPDEDLLIEAVSTSSFCLFYIPLTI